MWYKLSGQTKYAITITLLGLAVTVLGNLILMPRFSYWASASVHLLSCLIMLIYSAFLGAKYYPIPYKWRVILKDIFIAVGLYLVSQLFILIVEKGFGAKMDMTNTPLFILKIGINTLLAIVYLIYIEKNKHLIKQILKR